ncbi:pentapeptide repeat-containing protein [Crossiella sp. CA-258035]|uniref:pentapeptide repeat-containing protein n=1 Tax=Crossiella sp. CA-258035 TaxID=2981138 RepID=UPI0024BCBF47|nr:pentapeptide repeat-containing protein [Crossiella sp. CA-258035]WHT20239.1 pentapeptide repeat-containing protein [Crossiella sp. CA-258035]
MEFLELTSDHTVQRPSIDLDDLTPEPAGFRGEVTFRFAHLHGGDQSNVTGEGSLTRTVVEEVSLNGAHLAPLEMTDVRCRGLDLSNGTLGEVTAQRVEWRQCQAIGLSLHVSQAANLLIDDCRLDLSTITVDRVKGIVVFRGCSLREATITGDLSNVVFLGCDLTAAEFAASRAEGADLRTSRLDRAHGLATLRGAIISSEQAASVAEQLATEAGLTVRGS